MSAFLRGEAATSSKQLKVDRALIVTSPCSSSYTNLLFMGILSINTCGSL